MYSVSFDFHESCKCSPWLDMQVDLHVRTHQGRIQRSGASLLDAFLFQRAWDNVHNRGKQEGWTPAQYKDQIDETLQDFDTGRLVPDWRGALPMPIGIRAYDPARDVPHLSTNQRSCGLTHLMQWREHCASQNLEVRLVPSRYEPLLQEMLDMKVQGAVIGVMLPISHLEVFFMALVWEV